METLPILSPIGLSQIAKPTPPQSATTDISKVLKEANSFISNLKGLFAMGGQFKEMIGEEAGQGTPSAKYEKGVEAGRKLQQKNYNVELIINEEGAFDKCNDYIETLLNIKENDKTIDDLKKTLKEQMSGENKPLIKNMIADFIRSYATAKIIK